MEANSDSKADVIEQLNLIKYCLKSRRGLYECSILTANIAASAVSACGGELDGVTPVHAYVTGILLNVGKLFLPDYMHENEEALTPWDVEAMKGHPARGAWFVKGTIFDRYSEQILRHHECQADGYPNARTADEVSDHIKLFTLSDRIAEFLCRPPYQLRPSNFGQICREIKASVRTLFQGSAASCMADAVTCYAVDWLNSEERKHDLADILSAPSDSRHFRHVPCLAPDRPEGCGIGLCQNRQTPTLVKVREHRS